ncbi:hypothetical protein QFZ45_002235 [Pseudomonas synxantha]|nr:hypothetical protein [Pseudomonas synxantha]
MPTRPSSLPPPPTTMNQALSQARQVNMSADGVIEVLQ